MILRAIGCLMKLQRKLGFGEGSVIFPFVTKAIMMFIEASIIAKIKELFIVVINETVVTSY